MDDRELLKTLRRGLNYMRLEKCAAIEMAAFVSELCLEEVSRNPDRKLAIERAGQLALNEYVIAKVA